MWNRGVWYWASVQRISVKKSAAPRDIKACAGPPWWALKWPGTGNMAVCIYRPFRAFHCHSHSLTRENTSCYTANTNPRVLCASQPLRALSVCLSVCVCAQLCVSRDARCPKIECAPNYCCKHRCGKPGLPPPKSQTHHPAHSTLCVPVLGA